MMTEEKAKQIGSKQAIISVIIGLITAQLILVFLTIGDGFLNSFFWFREFGYILNLIIAILLLFIFAYYFGRKAGFEILIKKKEHGFVGFKYGFFIVALTTFITSLITFFQEGLDDIGTADNPFYDYIFKPLFWILLFGVLPILLVGFWFGKQIKKQGNKLK